MIFICILYNFFCGLQKKQRTVSASDRALEYFDIHYKVVLGDLWPSVRIALLTQKKTCAIINNFCEQNSYYTDFLDKGAYDIIEIARTRQQQFLGRKRLIEDRKNDTFDEPSDSVDNQLFDNSVLSSDHESEHIAQEIFKDADRTNLDLFIPAKRIITESDEDKIQELRQSIYTPRDVKVDVVKARRLNLAMDLCAVGFPAGNVNMFPDPKVDRPNGHLCELVTLLY